MSKPIPKVLIQRTRSPTLGPRRISFALLIENVSNRYSSIRRSAYSLPLLCCVALTALVTWWSFAGPSRLLRSGNSLNDENALDSALQQAAVDALGQREGAVIVMDPQTGRVRAVVNQRLAFESSFAPGSTIKPFTALAALRAGLIDKNSRTLCREHYDRKDFATVCSHPRNLPPFNPAEAIAYSCNYYFGTLGERLDEATLSETLDSFGFGKQAFRNDAAAPRGSKGTLLQGKGDPRNALGEGEYLQATPLQLITAYAALVNGGQLFVPAVASASDFQVQRRAQLTITPEQRAVIVEGMRGAVRYGTAARAQLNSTTGFVIGKTGTSTPSDGFRSQGWFVGFSSESVGEGLPAPGEVRLAVLVFLKRAHGANAAEISRPIFAEFNRLRGQTNIVATSEPTALAATAANAPADETGARVKVHLVRENVTREMSREEYVLGVVAAEGSSEDQIEALKALAVAARTYAVKNAARHTRDGFDFCTTTHCQRYQPVGISTLVQKADSRDSPALSRAEAAVRATEGEILRDELGHPADAYFSASCGGMTANLQTLWGVNAPPYLRGTPDEYCATMPHHSWIDTIATGSLLQALRSDVRTDPGSHLDQIVVSKRDQTGRAESISILGEHHRLVSGWDFKIIVGRSLGWNWLKSSRFEVSRSGSNFIFRGSGFGHGLGLCQEGAHVMAQRGAGYRQILGKYFPTTNVVRGAEDRIASLPRGDHPVVRDGRRSFTLADVIWKGDLNLWPKSNVFGPLARLTISSEHFRVNYPGSVPAHDAAAILRTLEATRADLLQRLAAAGLSPDRFRQLDIYINDSTGNFVGRTGQPPWAAAATKGSQVELQPIAVLRRRGILSTTLRHELAHALIAAISHERATRWLAEGGALYFAGEGQLLIRFAPPARMPQTEIEQALANAATADQMRRAYAAAYVEVRALVKQGGERGLWKAIARAASK
jgi:SpoIID/LytB domain protein